MMITVFTPTYNRGYIISNLYESLTRQTVKNFEWIVIDDGSTDHTEKLFQNFLKEKNDFSITYKKVPNGGKHRAINKGVSLAKGDLFFIVDSDDYLTDDAIERIVEVESSIPNDKKKKFAGVCGVKGYSKKEIVGASFEGKYLDITSLERSKYKISGDKAEVFYTAVLKKYPFPEYEGENFITEAVVWDRIAYDGFKLRFFNDIIYICDYLPDGLTAHESDLFNKNPHGFGVYIYQKGLFGVTRGVKKWEEIWKYYHQFQGVISHKEMSVIFHMTPIALRLRIIGLKIYYKLYDR